MRLQKRLSKIESEGIVQPSIMFTRLDAERNEQTLKQAVEKGNVSETTYNVSLLTDLLNNRIKQISVYVNLFISILRKLFQQGNNCFCLTGYEPVNYVRLDTNKFFLMTEGIIHIHLSPLSGITHSRFDLNLVCVYQRPVWVSFESESHSLTMSKSGFNLLIIKNRGKWLISKNIQENQNTNSFLSSTFLVF